MKRHAKSIIGRFMGAGLGVSRGSDLEFRRCFAVWFSLWGRRGVGFKLLSLWMGGEYCAWLCVLNWDGGIRGRRKMEGCRRAGVKKELVDQ